jgi:hypothetical protein
MVYSVQYGVLEHRPNFIQKAFSSEGLVCRVREVLEQEQEDLEQ